MEEKGIADKAYRTVPKFTVREIGDEEQKEGIGARTWSARESSWRMKIAAADEGLLSPVRQYYIKIVYLSIIIADDCMRRSA